MQTAFLLCKANGNWAKYSGGCAIGKRPIDIHIDALKTLGIDFNKSSTNVGDGVDTELIFAKREEKYQETRKINLRFPSVGATENILLSSVLSGEIVDIYNAAREPEIVDLQNFLNTYGAQITGAGTNHIRIFGLPIDRFTIGTELALGGRCFKNSKKVCYTIMPDRVEAGTYLVATAVSGGEVVLKNVCPDHLSAIINLLKTAKIDISLCECGMRIKANSRPEISDCIVTLPYPGFPTDMQAQLMTLFSIAKGKNYIIESVFENRCAHVYELRKMHADIAVVGNCFAIRGIPALDGANVVSHDLRGGAALLLAGLGAKGVTTILDDGYITRGYANIIEKFRIINAEISKE